MELLMKLNSKNIPWIIVAFLLIVIVLLRSCSGADKICPQTEPTIIVKVDTTYIYDTLIKKIFVTVLKPGDSIYVDNSQPVDTAKILRTYFTKYAYTQVLEDSSLKATISDTVYKNKIAHRSFTYQWKKPQLIIEKEITKTVTEPKRAKVFIGFEIGGSKQGFTNLSPRITYLSKNDKSYSARVNPFDQSVHVGMDFKIKLKK